NAMDGRDLLHSAGELRFLLLGRSGLGTVLMVAYTQEYRKWRNDPNHQCAACESEGKSGVREHGRLISQTFQRLLLSSCTRCDASDVRRSANRRVNSLQFGSIRE